MIEVKHLRLVDAVAKEGTLKKAAERLFLTQSALSHQLKELENNLGTPVFYRINNQLHFTPAGKEFLAAGQEVLDKLADLEHRVQQVNQEQMKQYVHGYSDAESQRLVDQATSIADILHYDSTWPAGTRILEVGCGVGAQTRIVSQQNPDCQFVSVDISEKSLQQAKTNIDELAIANVTFKQADVFELPYAAASFDHVFVCFLLEHLGQPEKALLALKKVLKPGGSITVIEGDHGSTYFYPDHAAAREAIQAQVTLQQQNGGNANIGRTLYPMLSGAGFAQVGVTPRQVYVDDSKPELVNGFTKNTFTAMIQGIAEEAIAKQVISQEKLTSGINALHKTAAGGGTFCYTFFKAVAINPAV